MAHFDQSHFVSCEDQLPPISFSLHPNNYAAVANAGQLLFNPACSATSVLLMALPYRTWTKARQSTNMSPEIVVYLVALTHIFYANLHQHVASSYILDLDISAALHSIALSWVIYEQGGGREAFSFLLPARMSTKWKTSRVVPVVASLAALGLPFWAKDADTRQQLAAGLGGVAALTVVPVMGYLSWQQRGTQNGNLFGKWVLACIGVGGSQLLVDVEKNQICKMKEPWARWFHAIVIHAEIYALFWAVTECALGLVVAKQRARTINSGKANDDKKKKS